MKRFLMLFLFILPWALTAQAKIDEAGFKALLAADKSVVVLDVRTAEEWAAGHLGMAKLLPYDTINATTAAKSIPSKTTPIVVYCRSGNRSGIASQTLKQLGYTNIRDFGALSNWKGPIVTGK